MRILILPGKPLTFLVLFFSVVLAASSFAQQALVMPKEFSEKVDFEQCEAFRTEYARSLTQGPSTSNSSPRMLELQDLNRTCLKQVSYSFVGQFLAYGTQGRMPYVNEESLNRVLAELRANPFLPHDWVESGNCFYRANMTALYFFNRGITVTRAFVGGDLSSRGPLTNRIVPWSMHVAVVVTEKNPFGDIDWVVDPSLSERVLSISDWSKLVITQGARGAQSRHEIMNALAQMLSSESPQILKDKVIQETAINLIGDISETLSTVNPAPARYQAKMPEILRYLIYAPERPPQFLPR